MWKLGCCLLQDCRHDLNAIPSNCQATANCPQHGRASDPNSLFMCAERHVATKAARDVSAKLNVCMMPIISK